MNEQQTNRLTSQKIQSMMYQLDKTHFENFNDMIKYLQEADSLLSDKIERIDLKIESVNQQFVRTSNVYEMNNKKRQKQQQLLKLQRDRISKDLQAHKIRLSQFSINPITLVLKQKKYELQKLNQTKEIIEEFNKLVKGKEDQIKKILPLDEKNFSNSAMKIYVFKVLLQDIHGVQYEPAKLQINKKYTELKNKIIQNFKQGFWNKDTKLIRNTLPYCQQYELMDQISEFYNQQVFKSVHKITKLSCQMQYSKNSKDIVETQEGQSQIKNMFFLIQQGFNSAFSYKDQTTGQTNPNQINNIMGQYSQVVGRKLVTYVFQKIIRQSLQNILKATASLSAESSQYLAYLQIFYDQCKKLLKSADKIIKQQRTLHLMSTYFESIFDTYLDSYISKQLNNLDQTYERCQLQISKQIEANANNGMTQFTRDRQKKNMFSDDKKKTIKNIFDYAIESKKNLFQGASSKAEMAQQIANATNQAIKQKIQNLSRIFMNPWLQRIFSTTKKALSRNKKIAKINQVDKNRNQILQVFLSNIQQLILNLISLISEIVPPFEQRVPLQPEFFQLVPQINMLLHRIQFMYQEYKKQNCYRLADTIKLDQTKQNLILKCGKSLSNVVGQALASILTIQTYILKQQSNQYYIINPDKAPMNKSCSQIITFLEKYIRVIQKIMLNNFRANLLKTLGLQFVNNLITYYSEIPYTKQGLSRIFMDIAKYKSIISQFYSDEVDNRFKILRSLIDIYVIKNDEKSIEQYVKGQPHLNNKLELKKSIQSYIINKLKSQNTDKKK